ncbi:hypothetical protein L596_000802 [Steinernema carpocapsae]|uniref:T-box domain-containing protein n=1 Tax=Steinernema carpocapsae TaxID=34508 RepID=A0A4U8UND7_STECR|nr:hypothetical protein L596_000802 [Steinernema carpocapsae]
MPQMYTNEPYSPIEFVHQPQAMDFSEQNTATARIEDEELWAAFNEQVNEMILTKKGRKMFPHMAFQVGNLIPNNHYVVAVSFNRVNNQRYKYHDSKWIDMNNGLPMETPRVVFAREGVQTGVAWNKRTTVKFDRVKLTNTVTKFDDVIVTLNSMHKYRPHLCVFRINGVQPQLAAYPYPNKTLVADFKMPLMDFIAVTAYNNNEIKLLKVDHNKYAKGFRPEGKHTQNRMSLDEQKQLLAKRPSEASNLKMTRQAVNPVYAPNNQTYWYSSMTPQTVPYTNTTPQNYGYSMPGFNGYSLPGAPPMTSYPSYVQRQDCSWQPNYQQQCELPMDLQNLQQVPMEPHTPQQTSMNLQAFQQMPTSSEMPAQGSMNTQMSTNPRKRRDMSSDPQSLQQTQKLQRVPSQ